MKLLLIISITIVITFTILICSSLSKHISIVITSHSKVTPYIHICWVLSTICLYIVIFSAGCNHHWQPIVMIMIMNYEVNGIRVRVESRVRVLIITMVLVLSLVLSSLSSLFSIFIDSTLNYTSIYSLDSVYIHYINSLLTIEFIDYHTIWRMKLKTLVFYYLRLK